MVSLRTKVLSAVSRTGTPSRLRSRSLILPKCRSAARHRGHSALFSGLFGASPLYSVSSLTAVLESALGEEADLSQVKCALRVLSTVGNAVAGVPWLRGVAELGLGIVNLLEAGISWKE